MPAQILDGNKIAAQVRAEVAEGVARLKEKRGITPGLSVILVGENPASHVYVRNKARAAQEVGINAATIALPKEASEAEIIDKVQELNRDPQCHGILVQLPLPSHI
ncbi:MAG: folD, partial [Dehalococcoidia bacterium]|nr:folD [Dehalococcoidia bacterium]